LVDARQRERTLREGLVEIREVDAQPHSPVRLWDYHGFASHMGCITSPISLAFLSFWTSSTMKS
jgi:hypothetical protein